MYMKKFKIIAVVSARRSKGIPGKFKKNLIKNL